jgi:hypothetical protein
MYNLIKRKSINRSISLKALINLFFQGRITIKSRRRKDSIHTSSSSSDSHTDEEVNRISSKNDRPELTLA